VTNQYDTSTNVMLRMLASL